MFASFVHALNLWGLGIACAYLFFTPGLYFALKFRQKGFLEESDLWPATVLASGSIAYSVFYAYLLDYRVGRAISYSLILGAILGGRMLWREIRLRKQSRAFLFPITLIVSAYLFYSGLCVSPAPEDSGSTNSTHLILYDLPGDNLIPYTVGQNMFLGKDARVPIPSWQSSDRPPLQTGVFLQLHPLTHLFPLAQIYECAAIFFQVIWVAALLFLCGCWGFSRRVTAAVLGFALLSGSFYINSVFVWPKLGAAAFFIFGFGYLCFKNDRPSHYLLGGLGAALGMLGHGGIAFSLIALAVCYPLFKRPRPVLLAWSALAFFLLYTPWVLYQKFYDPPGNRLIKWHLAGSPNVDERGVGQTLREAYSGLTLREWVSRRGKNLYMFYPTSPWPTRDRLFTRDFWGYYRSGDFVQVLHDLGVMNLGFLIFFLSLAIPSLRARLAQATSFPAKRILAYWVVGQLVWVSLMFSGYTTALFTGSYAFPILIYAWLGYFLCTLPPLCLRALLAARIVYFLFAFVLFSNEVIRVKGYPPLFLAGFAGLAIFAGTLSRWIRSA